MGKDTLFGREGGNILLGANTLDYHLPAEAYAIASQRGSSSDDDIYRAGSSSSSSSSDTGTGNDKFYTEIKALYLSTLKHSFPDSYAQVLRRYPATTPWQSWQKARADACTVCPALSSADFFYLDAAETLLYKYDMAPIGVAHSNIANVFGLQDSVFYDANLSDIMMTQTAEFIMGIPPWKPVNASNSKPNAATYMSYANSQATQEVEAVYNRNCEFWWNTCRVQVFCSPMSVPGAFGTTNSSTDPFATEFGPEGSLC